MDSTVLLTISFSLVAALFGLLNVVIGWVGSRLVNKQDELMGKLDSVRSEIHSVKDDLHDRINGLDIRLVRVETLVDDEK